MNKVLQGLLVVLLLAVMVGGSDISAQERKVNVFKDCGLGAMIFNETKEDRTWAAVVNYLAGPGMWTTASSSKSSDTCAGEGSLVAAKFINETYTVILEETTKGSGDHLTTVLDLMSCDKEVQGAVISSIQSGVVEMMTDPSYESKTQLEKSETYYNIVDNAIASEEAFIL